MTEPLRQVTIIGTGLLGASLGLALKKQGLAQRIVGVGRNAATVERARARGAVDVAAADVAEACREAELVVLATPLSSFEQLFHALSAVEQPDWIITDVGSTKSSVCGLARRYLKYPKRFVGSHPMAGSEQQGPDAACADLFAGKPCVITPEPDTDPAALERVSRLWTDLGMRVLRMSAADHDAAVARISHLPHLLAVLLVHLADRGGALEVASTGFADTTRIASGDPHLWADVFLHNRDAVLATIDALTADLTTARHLIAAADPAVLTDWLAQAKQARDAWRQKS